MDGNMAAVVELKSGDSEIFEEDCEKSSSKDKWVYSLLSVSVVSSTIASVILLVFSKKMNIFSGNCTEVVTTSDYFTPAVCTGTSSVKVFVCSLIAVAVVSLISAIVLSMLHFKDRDQDSPKVEKEMFSHAAFLIFALFFAFFSIMYYAANAESSDIDNRSDTIKTNSQALQKWAEKEHGVKFFDSSASFLVSGDSNVLKVRTGEYYSLLKMPGSEERFLMKFEKGEPLMKNPKGVFRE